MGGYMGIKASVNGWVVWAMNVVWRIRWYVLLVGLGGLGLQLNVQAQISVTGAGATFPYPLYAKWADVYRQSTGVTVNYQSIGSGGGIKQISAGTVHFGASDMPLSSEELDKQDLVQFPVVVGGVVVVLNLPGIASNALRLDAEALSGIWLGNIKKWNDPILKRVNPNLNLPDKDILVVNRADGSGTTFLWTTYLSKISPEWQKKVGAGTSVKWPVGVGGKGNEGVASYVGRLPGAIAYLEYTYSAQNNLVLAALQNQSGQFIAPSPASFRATLNEVQAKWSKEAGMPMLMIGVPGAQSWPITGATFILLRRSPAKVEETVAAIRFYEWALTKGGGYAEALHYIPLPEIFLPGIRAQWGMVKNQSGKSVYP